jgi:GTP-binding protein
MFVDEITIKAKAGNGGDGVVRWHREKFIPKGGPAGGNGGDGGSVYMRAVRDLGLLSKYTGTKEFTAKDGVHGAKRSRHGHGGEDIYIDVPVGATVTDNERERVFKFTKTGQTELILRGGQGGLGNEHFKSSVNTTPEESTKGKKGEAGEFLVELSLVVDIGFVGVPNAGKSTMLNALTNTKAKIGSYPFTTVEPHLGDLYGFILADIPGLIEGASEGKGLGHKFLKHIERTKMILHCVALDNEDPLTTYKMIREELGKHDSDLLKKVEWVLLTKSDLVTEKQAERTRKEFQDYGLGEVFTVSAEVDSGLKELQEHLVRHLEAGK